MKAVKMLLGACLNALSEMLALLVFVIMAVEITIVLGAIIAIGFPCWLKGKRVKNRPQKEPDGGY